MSISKELLDFEDEGCFSCFAQKLIDLDKVTSSFTCLSWLFQNEFLYMSPTIEKVLGHPSDKFENYGFVRFQQLILDREIFRIYSELDRQLFEMESSSESIFLEDIFKVDGPILDKEGEEKLFRFSTSILDVRYFEKPVYLIVGNWMLLDGKTESEIAGYSSDIKENLLGVKKIYMKGKPEHFKMLRIQKQISAREKEVASLLAEGFSTKAISERLKISFNTVETHRKNLLAKLEAKNSTELIFKVGKLMSIN